MTEWQLEPDEDYVDSAFADSNPKQESSDESEQKFEVLTKSNVPE
jgi:hypothetical protein